MSFLEALDIRQLTFSDILDILIIWFIIYNVLRLMRGTRTKQMGVGLLALFVIQFLAERFQLVVLSKLINSFFNIIPIAIIVLFQEEIRRILASIGTNLFAKSQVPGRTTALDSIFQATIKLAKEDIGALIVFEGQQGLRDYIESGTRLDARPSVELLADIFQPKSNLHDGAIVISDERLASAACLLPLSQNPGLPKHYGTRHRAAAGITEASDCIALVVSEETGQITFFWEGEAYPVKEKTISQMYETFNNLRMPDSTERMDRLRRLSRSTLKLPLLKRQNEVEEDRKVS